MEKALITAVRRDIASHTRAAADAVIQSHFLATRNISETVTSEHVATRQGLVDAMARERAHTIQTFELEHIITRRHVSAVLTDGMDTSKSQVLAAVSGLSLAVTNSVDQDRAHRARQEERLEELVRRMEAIAGIADLVQRIRLPGILQLRLGWQLMIKCFGFLPDTHFMLTTRDAVTGATVLALTARNGHIRSAYAAMAIGLLVWRQARGVMYRVPIVHMVFVFDFFDSRIYIPLDEVKSSEVSLSSELNIGKIMPSYPNM